MTNKKKITPIPDTPFMNVDDAARATGLSKYYLRHELAAGNVPHIRTGKNGRCIRINVPALLRKLGAEN